MKKCFYWMCSFILLITAGCATVPSTPKVAPLASGMRHYMYADLMDNFMRTKTIRGVMEELSGYPYITDYKYVGFTVYRYDMKYKRRESKGAVYEYCKMFFVTENPSRNGKIVGWQTNCDDGREDGLMHADAIIEMDQKYGALPMRKPIPQAVIPKSFQASIENSKTRSQTFPDFLSSYLGKSQQSIASDRNFYNNLVKTEKLASSGMLVETYHAKWTDQVFYQAELIAFVEGWGQYEGGMVPVNKSCPFSFYYSKGVVVGYDAEKCKDFRFKGDAVPLKTPQAPWRLIK